MASLSTILQNKREAASLSGQTTGELDPLERGTVYAFVPAPESSSGDYQNFCWQAPSSGTAVIEIWGASGSGGYMACCGAGIPGNPGAYARKTVTFSGSGFICGFAGGSCGNASQVCCRGCSEHTAICWSGVTNGCMCAMGGRGGVSYCTTNPGAPFCCFANAGFSVTAIGNCCGIVCNWCDNGGGDPDWAALAYGGDVNCPGGYSYSDIKGNRGSQNCNHVHYLRTSAGVYSTDGAVLALQYECDVGHSNNAGHGVTQTIYAINAASRTPSKGMPYMQCWIGWRPCGSYVAHGTGTWLPHGVPGGPPSIGNSNQNDYAIRGGPGAVRIKFIGS